MNTRLEYKELWPDELPNSFKNRVDETIEYLAKQHLKGNIADCGENNPMKMAIEKNLNVTIDSIDWEFNSTHNIRKKYDVILCFEVLEHVMNPLLFLNELKRILNTGGIIYLSTPYQFPQVLKAIHHYHEIPEDRLKWLFHEAQLEIHDKIKITIAGNWYNHIGGVRPMLRYLQKTRLYKLKDMRSQEFTSRE